MSLSVNLSPDQKGIHMSRLLETALDFNGAFSLENMASFLIALCDRQGSKDSDVKIEFDYFFNRHAPVSGKISPQPYTCAYLGEMHSEGIRLTQSVVVPVKTLCPCSKEISDYGAHNQRSKVFITILHEEKKENDPIDICFEEIIGIAERGASSPLYPLLKREDERHVTMSAYNKPCFVEDVVRNIASELHGNPSFDSYKLRVLNYESIHSPQRLCQHRQKILEQVNRRRTRGLHRLPSVFRARIDLDSSVGDERNRSPAALCAMAEAARGP